MNQEIPEKETLDIEFKSDLPKGYPDADLVDEVVAIANTHGGIIYLGVEDDATPTGLSKGHMDSIGLEAMVANKTVPSVSVRAEIIPIKNINVMTIEVPEMRTVVSTSSGKILRRKWKADGTPESVPMYAYEIQSRLSDLSLLDFSAQALTSASIDDLDPNQMVRLRSSILNNNGDKSLLELSDVEIQRALHFVSEQNNKLTPTITGMLMVGKEESIARLMPTVRADFQVLEGMDVKINQSYTKTILETAELFEEYLKPWNPEQEMDYGMFRMAIPAFDQRAFREGVMNAFAHRDYSMLGRIRIEINDEGMTISSPGGFLEGINAENLIEAEPQGRNQTLADAIKRTGLAERTGRGIDRIFAGSIYYGRQWPDYSASTSNRVILFIPRGNADLPFIKMLSDYQKQKGHPLSINYLLILSCLKTERKMNVKRLRETTHINEAKIRTIVELLLEDGLIEELGSRHEREYILNKRFYKKAGKEKEYVRISQIEKVRYEEMIVKLARTQNGIITKSDVQELLHIKNYQAYNLISQLVQQGKLKKTGGGRYTKYQLIE